MSEPPVRAAGGVVWRRNAGTVEVLLVHRPKYDDWTLPKGKAEPGETDEECARREVEEETGLRCRLGDEVGSTAYRDQNGRPKVVRYWEMQPVEGSFEPHDEIDEVRWIAVDDALRALTYKRERPVLRRLRTLIRDERRTTKPSQPGNGSMDGERRAHDL